MIVCHCERVSKRKVVKAIRAGSTSLAAVGRATGAGRGCASCHPALRQLLDECGRAEPGQAADGEESPHAAA